MLQDVAEHPELHSREYNRAFVLMQYFGYLRRDPDEAGYQFWVGKLNLGTTRQLSEHGQRIREGAGVQGSLWGAVIL